jgi:hypothetical protein
MSQSNQQSDVVPCKCGRVALFHLVYDKNSSRGLARYTSPPKCMRCADKEAFAVIGRRVSFVRAVPVKGVDPSESEKRKLIHPVRPSRREIQVPKKDADVIDIKKKRKVKAKAVVKRKPKAVAEKEAPVRKRKRKSTAEPKTIIKRSKKATARKKRGAAEKETVARGRKRKAISEDAPKKKAVKADITGTDAKVGKQIVKLRDSGESWPKIRARTGLSGKRVRDLYEETSGKPDPRARGPRTAKSKKSAAKGNGRRRRTRETENGEKPAVKKTAARGRKKRTAKSKAAAKAGGRRSASGRRASRRNPMKLANRKLLDEVIHDLDTKGKAVAEALNGRTIDVGRTIEGRPMKTTSHRVVKVKTVKKSDREGRVIGFIDENQQSRFVASREIVALR